VEKPTDRSTGEIFHTLDLSGSRKNAFGLSVVVHAILLTTLLLIPLMFTETIKFRYQAVLLAPPPPEKPPVLEVTYWKQPPPVNRVRPEPLVAPPPPKPLLTLEKPPEPEPEKPK
jgi:hypothetical protein